MRKLIRVALKITRVIDFDAADLWRRLEAKREDTDDYVHLATRIAEVDGPVSEDEAAAIEELRVRQSAGDSP